MGMLLLLPVARLPMQKERCQVRFSRQFVQLRWPASRWLCKPYRRRTDAINKM
jgi:hypothetical protein